MPGAGASSITFWWRRCKRAIALEQVDDIAVAVAEDLHLDMARGGDPLLQQHFIIAKARLGLALAAFEAGGEVFRRIHLAHALAAAACDRLDQHGIANGLGFLGQSFHRLVLAQIARRDRHTGGNHALLGGILKAHRADALRLWSHPNQPRLNHGAREVCVLR